MVDEVAQVAQPNKNCQQGQAALSLRALALGPIKDGAVVEVAN
jgi:hypothetical protein